MFLVAEIFRNRQARQADAETRSGWLGHLSIDQSRAGFFGISGNDDAGFLEFQPQVVAFTRAFAYARENGNAAVLHGHVVNQFLNQNRLADARAAEQTDFSALQKGLDQVDNLNSGFKHFERGGLLVELRSRTVNRIIVSC